MKNRCERDSNPDWTYYEKYDTNELSNCKMLQHEVVTTNIA